MAIVGKASQGVSAFSINNDAITWRARLSYCTLLVLWAYVFTPTLKNIFIALTKIQGNQHGILVIPLLLVLLYSKRSIINRIAPSVCHFGLLLLFLLSAIWIFALISGIELLQQICVIALLPAMFMLTFGYKISKILSFPLSFLFFVLPVGQLIIPNIQDWLLIGLVKSFAWFNLPVYWEQQSICTMYSVLDITKLSTGLNFSLVFLALGFSYAYFISITFWRRLLIASSFVLFPGILVFMGIEGLVFYETLFHKVAIKASQLIYYSWSLISLGLLSSISFGLMLRQYRPYTDSLTKVDWQSSWRYSDFNWLMPTIIAAITLIILPFAAANLQNNTWTHYKEIIYNHPNNVSSWLGPEQITRKIWQPNFPTATTAMLSNYQQANNTVQFFTAYYYAPLQAARFLQQANKLYDPNVWQLLHTMRKQIYLATNNKVELIETLLTDGHKPIIMWHWYYLANVQVTNKFMLPIVDAMRILFNMGDDAGVMAMITEVNDDVEISRQLLQQFLTAIAGNLPQLMHPKKAF